MFGQVTKNIQGSFWIRLCYFGVSYFSQGVAIGFWLITIPAWLVGQGHGAAEVGPVVAALTGGWALSKLIGAVFIDRFKYLPMGRQRPWIMLSQSAYLMVLLFMAVLEPQPSGSLVYFALSVAAAMAVQDAAVDALAVELSPPRQRGRVNGVMFGGQTAGVAISATTTGVLLDAYGLSAAVLFCFFVGSAAFCLTAVISERPRVRQFSEQKDFENFDGQSDSKVTWIELACASKRLMKKNGVAWFALTFAVFGSALAFIDVLGPVFARENFQWDQPTYSRWLGIVTLCSGILGLIAIGPLIDPIGAERALLGGVLIGLLSVASLLWRTAVGITVGEFQALLLMLFISAQICSISFAVMAMAYTEKAAAASQYAIFTFLPNLGRSLSAYYLGTAASEADSNPSWIFFLVVSIGATVSALVLVIRAPTTRPAKK